MFEGLNLDLKDDREEALGIVLDKFKEYCMIISQNQIYFDTLDELLTMCSVEVDFDTMKEKWEEETDFFEVLDCLIAEVEEIKLLEVLETFEESITGEIGSNYLEKICLGRDEFIKNLDELDSPKYELKKWKKKEEEKKRTRESFYYAMKLEQEHENEWKKKGLYDKK